MARRFSLGYRVLVVLMLATMVVTGLAGCKKEDVFSELTIAFSDDISNLDPAQVSIAADRGVIENVYNGLTQFNLKTYEVVPALAESWDVSPDGLTYTFHLREGVMFHKDYGEMTSEDVAYTLLRHKDPEVKSRDAATFKMLVSVETPDKYTAVVKLTTVCPAFPALLAWQSGYIVCKKAVEELGADYPLNPIGTGAYYFDSWVQKEKVVLKAHETYWKGKPEVDQVTVRIIPDESIAVDAVGRGEIDMVALYQVAAYRAALNNPNVQLFTGESGYVNFLWLQTKKPPTDDLRVRQAIAYALDLPAMKDAIGGMLISSNSILNPLCVGYKESFNYPHDLDKAKALIAECNLPAGTKLIMYYRKAHLYETIALMAKDQIEKILPVELVQLDASNQSAKFREGNFNVGVWATTRLESDLYLSQQFITGGGGNYMGYGEADVDALIDAGRTELDPVKRAEIYGQLQDLVAADVPCIPTGLLASVIVAGDRIKDVWCHPYPGIVPVETVVLEGK